MNSTPEQKTLCTEDTAVDWAADAVPLRELQNHFADLFERAAYVVQCKGYEQDDTVVDRLLICRVGNQTHVVEAAFISDEKLLQKHLLASIRASLVRTADPTDSDGEAPHPFIPPCRGETEGSQGLSGSLCELCDIQIIGLRAVATLDTWPEKPNRD